jgi:Caspase domain
MKRHCASLVAVLLGAVLLPSVLSAETRRALLVGIDRYLDLASRSDYRPSASTQARMQSIHGKPARIHIPTLEGSVNDAQAVKEMLLARYGFKESDIILLKDEDATADRILGLLQAHLIDAARPGDVAFFYYAGHGSRIRNTSPLNTHQGGYDSTIVPADAGLGVPDVRSKELARIYDRAADKGVSLTVILDSCYSGAASRGALASRKIRAQPSDGEISVDEALEGKLPEERGVLFISAAQEYEPAAELSETDLNGAHGAFTWALLHVLGASAPDDSVDRIFQRVRALMQSKVWDQEPVLLARNGRNRLGLFGQNVSSHRNAPVAVARVNGSTLRLNGGLASNLHEDCELVRVAPSKPEVTIKIVKVDGLASSEAVLLGKGTEAPAVRPGDLFELVKWVVPDRELMRLWTGPAVPAFELKRMSGIDAQLRKRRSIQLVEDPTVDPPSHVLSWDGPALGWRLRENRSGATPEGIARPTASEIHHHLPGSGARLFLQAGPSESLLASLRFEDRAILRVDTPEHADYALLGRFCGAGCTEYAWGNPASDGHPKAALAPTRTDWLRASEATAKLRGNALELAKIVGWLDLNAPGFDAGWPYQLAFEDTRTKKLISSSEVRVGERYKLMLRESAEGLRVGIPSRRVYVFTVDSFGETKLLFGDNLENEFPRMGEVDPAQIFPLTAAEFDLEIGPPYGVDNFFLLASATPIDNPETVFNSSGVRTRSGTQNSPLARLIEQTVAGKRGPITGIPTNWSIQHLTLITSRGEPK